MYHVVILLQSVIESHDSLGEDVGRNYIGARLLESMRLNDSAVLFKQLMRNVLGSDHEMFRRSI